MLLDGFNVFKFFCCMFYFGWRLIIFRRFCGLVMYILWKLDLVDVGRRMICMWNVILSEWEDEGVEGDSFYILVC